MNNENIPQEIAMLLSNETDLNNLEIDDEQLLFAIKQFSKPDVRKEAFEFMRQSSEKFARLMSYYKCAMMEIETKFNVLNEEFSLQFDRNPISSIRSRLKSMTSIKGKLDRKNLPITLDSIENRINDVAGVRVICSFPEDVYMLASSLLQQDDIRLIKSKDYIANPKSNGYRSLHLIVSVPIFLAHEKRCMKVEIQLRTIAMDFWASLEHQMGYKKTHYSEEMLRELYECAELSAQLDLRMQMLQKEIARNERIKDS